MQRFHNQGAGVVGRGWGGAMERLLEFFFGGYFEGWKGKASIVSLKFIVSYFNLILFSKFGYLNFGIWFGKILPVVRRYIASSSLGYIACNSEIYCQ